MQSIKSYLPAISRLGAVICLALMIAAGHAPAAQPDNQEAISRIDDFHQHLIAIMRDGDSLDFSERYARLEPVIESKFDFPIIARVILSRYWDELDTQQRDEFITVFSELTTATYADRFTDYDNETFENVGTESLSKKRLLVQTRLHSDNDEPVKLDYLMHERDGIWYIMSVVAQGVNDLSMKRAEYTAIIKAQGFAGLVSELRSKIKQLRTNRT